MGGINLKVKVEQNKDDNILNHWSPLQIMLNYIPKQRFLVLVTTEMHFIFDTLSRTQAFMKYLHLGVWVRTAEALQPEARKTQHSEAFQLFNTAF